MTGLEYETLVRILMDALVRNTPLTDCSLAGGAENRLVGASGFQHQIDISMRCQSLLLLVECKNWSRPVGAEPVLSLASRLADIRAANLDVEVRASIVSTQVATRGAQQLALHHGISVDTVANAQEYAVRLSNQVCFGVHEKLDASDQMDLEIIPAKRS